MNRKNIIIIGAGGHTRSLINLIDEKLFNIEAIYDDSYNPKLNDQVSNIKIMGYIEDIPLESKIILSVGDNFKRKKLYEKYFNLILTDNLKHKKSFIEQNVTLVSFCYKNDPVLAVSN